MKQVIWWRTIAACALSAITAACGGGGADPSGPGPIVLATPSPAPQVLQQSSGQVEALTVVVLPAFTLSQAGMLETTVDWTFARNDIDVAVTRGACTADMFNARQCSIIEATSSVTAKPERLRLSLAAGAYTVLIANFSEEDESVAFQVVFTPGATASAAARGAGSRRSWDGLSASELR